MTIIALLWVTLFPADSLPPLPDVTRFAFPEPPVYVEPQRSYLGLFGKAGQSHAAGCSASVRGFNAGVSIDHHDRWRQCTADKAAVSYSLSVSRLYSQPALKYFRQVLLDTTTLIRPMLDLRFAAPRFVAYGSIARDRWKINDQQYGENEASLGVIFDRALYPPALDIAILQSGKVVRSCFAGTIHMNRLHAGIASFLPYGFPSPRLYLAYRQPILKLEAALKSGIDCASLNDFYRPETPFRPPFPVPDESLKIRADLDCVFDYICQRLQLGVTYRNNRTRLVIQDGQTYGTVGMVEEALVVFKTDNKITAGVFTGRNFFTGAYAWTSLPIPYQARFAMNEEIELRCGLVFLKTAASFLRERPGVSTMLPDLLMLDLQCGLAYEWLSFYVAVHNATDVRENLYEGYGLSPRNYAGGMDVTFWFW